MSLLAIFANACYNCGYINLGHGEPKNKCIHCKANLRWQDEQNFSKSHREELSRKDELSARGLDEDSN